MIDSQSIIGDEILIIKSPDETFAEALRKVAMAINHYEHTVDVSSEPYYCSECDVYIEDDCE